MVIEDQRRAVLVSFGDPVTPGTEDFTADVIIGVDNEGEVGIFIPNLPEDDWDASAPEEHTRWSAPPTTGRSGSTHGPSAC